MLKKMIVLALTIMLAAACPVAGHAGVPPESYSSKGNDERAAEYYRQADEKLRGVYYNAMDVIESGHAGDFRKGKSTGEWFFSLFYSTYAAVKHAAPFIALVSVLLGATICFFAKRNKLVFRRALLVFVLGVPFALVIFVFGLGSMTTIFG